MDDLPSLPWLLAAIAIGLAPGILVLLTGVIGRVLRAVIKEGKGKAPPFGGALT